MPMKNPPHPGRSIRSACLEPLGLSVTEGAKILGVTRQTLNNVINGKSGISPEMAIRLTKAFGSTEETWLRMQLAYDLAQARKSESKIPGIAPALIARYHASRFAFTEPLGLDWRARVHQVSQTFLLRFRSAHHNR